MTPVHGSRSRRFKSEWVDAQVKDDSCRRNDSRQLGAKASDAIAHQRRFVTGGHDSYAACTRGWPMSDVRRYCQTAGFESALTNLGLKERNDPATTQIAKLIIQLAKDGQRDPKHLAERATRIVRGSSYTKSH